MFHRQEDILALNKNNGENVVNLGCKGTVGAPVETLQPPIMVV